MIIPDSPRKGWGGIPSAQLMVRSKVKNLETVLLLYPKLITLSGLWASYRALLIWSAQSSEPGPPTNDMVNDVADVKA